MLHKAFVDADIELSASPKSKNIDEVKETSPFLHPGNSPMRGADPNGGAFLRTNWQIQGYLLEQADAIEK